MCLSDFGTDKIMGYKIGKNSIVKIMQIPNVLHGRKGYPSFATGLKRIKDACDKAGCRIEFKTPDDGFVVVFYWHGTQKLSATAQKPFKKKKGSMRCLNIAKKQETEMISFFTEIG